LQRFKDFKPVKSAERALTVIELLTEKVDGLTFSEFEERTGWPRSSLYNLLRTMAERRHLGYDSHTHRYRIGIRIWEAGEAFISDNDLAIEAQPFLKEASRQLDETVQLAVLDGMENVYVAKVETDHFLRLVSKIGSRLPAYATGLGKVLLAALPERELLARLENETLEPFTAKTITSVDRLLDELRDVCKRGYAIDTGEFTQGVYCVAVPVRARGKVVAAMSSSVPDVRVSDRLRTAMFETLAEQADTLSKTLGGTLNPHSESDGSNVRRPER